jgi:PadR family transcriptional regulator, regulatory protein PadR
MAKAKRTMSDDLGNCPCTGRHTERFIQPAVLSLIAEEPLHGYLIVQRLREMPMFEGQAPDATGVYRFLKAMEKRGLVVSAWDVSRVGPARKQIRITDLGRECLQNWVTSLRGYHEQLGALLKVLANSARGRCPRRACCATRQTGSGRP